MIRLGTFLPLSGPLAPRGLPVLAGLQAYIARINAQGGVYGRELELIALDDRFNPAQAIPLAQQLVEAEKVFSLVAPLGTSPNKSALDYLERQGIPVIAPISGSSLLTTPPRSNYFALQVNYVVEGTLLANYAVETLCARRIAMYYCNDDFGQEGARAFQAELLRREITPVHVELGWREGVAAEPIIERLRAAEPDTVLLYTYLDQAAALLREAHRLKFQPQWLGCYVLWDPALFDLAGMEAAEGLIVGRPYIDPLGSEPAAVAFREDMERYAPDVLPGFYSASGYTAAALLAEGLNRAGPDLTRENFITALEGLRRWSGGLVTGISYSKSDRRGTKTLGLARAHSGVWKCEEQILAPRERLLNITAPLAMQVNILTRQVVEEQGKQIIKQKAIDVAAQCAEYIRQHPAATLHDLQQSEVFQQIASQSIGKMGYTAMYGPAPTPMMRIHPNPDLIDVDLRLTDRPTRFPDWWELYQYSLDHGGQEGSGFYNWEDSDGIVRQKFQYFLPIEGTQYILAATTYLGEFFQPFEEAENAIRQAVEQLTNEIARQILDPIQLIMEGVERVTQGELDYSIEGGPAEEAQELAQAFNQMTKSLREMYERWEKLNAELEARVVARTHELSEANRQLQISNRSLQEMNRQLGQAKSAAEASRLEAEEANRLKNRFLSNMSHELRIPLNAIINLSKLVLIGSEGPVNEGQADFIGRIRDAGEHLLGLLNDMLDLSQIESGVIELQQQETYLADIVRGVMSTAVGLTRDKQITLHAEISEALPPVWADPLRIRQVLLNLLANAAKFTERGQITIIAEAQNDMVLVSVTDTGIPRDEQIRIFQSSADTKGLGLSNSRRWVEMHGGSMWVESTPGFGAVFCFTLPLVKHAPHAQRESSARSLIMVVDSDQATYKCLAAPLEDAGFRVVGLMDANLLFSKVNTIHPGVLVLDTYQLPQVDRVIDRLNQRWPNLPVISAAYSAADQEGVLTDHRLGQEHFVEAVLEAVSAATKP